MQWLNGFIPSDELWIKLGGDNGHGHFKVAGGVFNIHEIHQLFSVNIDWPMVTYTGNIYIYLICC